MIKLALEKFSDRYRLDTYWCFYVHSSLVPIENIYNNLFPTSFLSNLNYSTIPLDFMFHFVTLHSKLYYNHKFNDVCTSWDNLVLMRIF